MNSLMKSVPLVLLAVLVLPATGGCGKKVGETVAEKVIEQAIKSDAKKDGKDVDVKVDLKGGSMSISGKDGDKQVNVKADGDSFSMTSKEGEVKMSGGKSAKIPDGFPKDIPVYAGAEVVMSMSTAENESFMVNLKASDTMDNVSAYYKKELKANGWKEESSVNQAGDSPMQMLSYSKEDRTTMLMISTEEGKTMVSIHTGKK